MDSIKKRPVETPVRDFLEDTPHKIHRYVGKAVLVAAQTKEGIRGKLFACLPFYLVGKSNYSDAATSSANTIAAANILG